MTVLMDAERGRCGMPSISKVRPTGVVGCLAIAAGLVGLAGPASADECEVEKFFLASDAAAKSELGVIDIVSVSLSGDTALIGASRDDDNGTDSGAAFIYRFDGATWIQEQKLLASDGAVFDRFGFSVSLSGDNAVIGAPGDDDNGIGPGSAYVYRFDGSTWVQEQKLLASDAAESDSFGRSVAISGEATVIGAPNNDDHGMNSGSAYVYRFDGSTWIEEQKLLASDASEFDRFGRSVSVDGDVTMIRGQETYVYRFDGSSWVEEQVLVDPGGANHNPFTSEVSVSVSGDTGVIGAPFDRNPKGHDTGAAYVYRFNGSTWIAEQTLFPFDGSPSDFFGNSVSVNGDTVVIGARNSDVAYVFRFDGRTWIEEQQLLPSDFVLSFSCSVSVSGDAALMGAANSAYVYRFDEKTWIEEQELLVASPMFGSSVSVEGDYAVIGAPYDLDNGIMFGSAFIYGFDGSQWFLDHKLLASDATPGDAFGSSVAVSGDVVVVGAPDDNDNGSDSGSAYVFRQKNTTWVQEQKLLASDGDANDHFGISVSISGNVVVIGAFSDDDNDYSGSAYVYRFDGATWVESRSCFRPTARRQTGLARASQ
jgi:hypothetical protein